MTTEAITIICSAVVTILTLAINSFFADRRFRNYREQDRLDRESQARIAQANKDEILRVGEERKKEILNATNQVKTVAVKSALKSEEALRVANGHNEKIAAAMEISKTLIETQGQLEILQKIDENAD